MIDDIQENNESFIKKITKNFTFIFTIVLLINVSIYIGSIFGVSMFNFSICTYPVFYKYQYYRIITHNFFHMNLIHITFNMIFFYSVGRELEKKLGSIYLFIIILESVLIISCIYLSITSILKLFIVSMFKFKEYNFDFYCSVGFSGILFSLYNINCSFNSTRDKYIYFFSLVPIKAKYSPLFYLLLIQIINPNSSLLGHFSGIASGYIIKTIFVYITFPKKDWIVGFEDKFQRIINILKNSANYIDIISIQNESSLNDMEEINKSLFDFPIFKFLRNNLRRNHQNLNEDYQV